MTTPKLLAINLSLFLQDKETVKKPPRNQKIRKKKPTEHEQQKQKGIGVRGVLRSRRSFPTRRHAYTHGIANRCYHYLPPIELDRDMPSPGHTIQGAFQETFLFLPQRVLFINNPGIMKTPLYTCSFPLGSSFECCSFHEILFL